MYSVLRNEPSQGGGGIKPDFRIKLLMGYGNGTVRKENRLFQPGKRVYSQSL
jgi:hypothetical protein